MVHKGLELGEARIRMNLLFIAVQKRSDSSEQRVHKNLEDETERRVISKVELNDFTVNI